LTDLAWARIEPLLPMRGHDGALQAVTKFVTTIDEFARRIDGADRRGRRGSGRRGMITHLAAARGVRQALTPQRAKGAPGVDSSQPSDCEGIALSGHCPQGAGRLSFVPVQGAFGTARSGRGRSEANRAALMRCGHHDARSSRIPVHAQRTAAAVPRRVPDGHAPTRRAGTFLPVSSGSGRDLRVYGTEGQRFESSRARRANSVFAGNFAGWRMPRANTRREPERTLPRRPLGASRWRV
jgi:hypothetical protein